MRIIIMKPQGRKGTIIKIIRGGHEEKKYGGKGS
jgi:hypothetical protein